MQISYSNKGTYYYTKLLIFLFYLFFMCPALSPVFNRKVSVYLYLFIPFLDFAFWKYLIKGKQDREKLVLALALIAASLFYLDLLFISKVFFLVYIVAYIKYTQHDDIRFINFFVAVNVTIAAIQFFMYQYAGTKVLDPNGIMMSLYGEGNTKTGATFHNGYLGMPLRVSGLSREPGYFSSLILTALIYTNHRRRNSIMMNSTYLLGILLSFSKMTLVFTLIYFITLPIKAIIRMIPKWLMIIGFLTSMYFVSDYLIHNFHKINYSQSILHRSIGYSILPQLNAMDMILGVGFENIDSRAGEIPTIKKSTYYNNSSASVVGNSGISSVIIDHGMVFFFLLVLIIYKYRAGSYMLFIYLLMLINSGPFTTLSYVILATAFLLSGREDRTEGYGIKRER